MSSKTKALNETLGNLDLLPPIVVEETAPYGEVLERMRQLRRGSIIVCRKGAVSGVFTERDYLYKHCLERIDLKKPIGELMSTRPVTVHADKSLGDAVEMMHQKRFRNLPIVDGQGRPTGMLTVGRIIRYLAEKFPAEVMNLPPVLDLPHDAEGA